MVPADASQSRLPDVQVVRALESDWPAIQAFFSREFKDHPRLSNSEEWHWKFLEQPGTGQQPRFLLLKVNGQIEGTVGFICFDIQYGERTISAIHPVNFFVSPNHKGLPALRLFRAVLREGELVIGSSISGDASRLLSKSGFIDLSAYLYAYHLGLRVTQSVGPRGLIIRIGRIFWTVLLRSFLRTTCHKLTYRIESSLDAMLLDSASHWPSPNHGIHKTGEYLRWRYAHSPFLNCCYIWQLDNGFPVGLAILHMDSNNRTAVLLDLATASPKLSYSISMVLRVIQHADESGMDILISHCMSHNLEKALRLSGCARRVSELGFMAYSTNATTMNMLRDTRKMHFVLGDTDLY